MNVLCYGIFADKLTEKELSFIQYYDRRYTVYPTQGGHVIASPRPVLRLAEPVDFIQAFPPVISGVVNTMVDLAQELGISKSLVGWYLVNVPEEEEPTNDTAKPTETPDQTGSKAGEAKPSGKK